ncbi:DHA2 family efflux MFS transporter permease subunit [Corynebacterium sanguinis]|mgnify:CR=1 FL=1|uniref:DHA2 family efflux MFS transporter permease subunit n=2 Tax=Corynebacterium sanguinis TaxID=2594913 RepID=UPI001184BDCA|nr:DHA2 family efflux MFS transporter permease subunit [Corynebacterium sanguinis]MCT1444477.1 DHA2 family efflux MFS transporter permease subunit [Corynebacterium sanguinis]MCT1492011.1 DHA2 family efflux MFS transporter permease subunit [Corynebacterium sanguinis]MCT2247501.1 DHA2 family efflux MFS transporter permease subunit [Corynebacterium sanguinis]MCT2287244.1 DHA2 family efflux MFS transporter permease subunit [Corynebacterium sanguinis]QDR78514.1 DHA2 family efflux MFS transporter pe
MMIGFFMILVDSTVVAVAIPAITAAFDASYNAVIWVNSAYLLAYAVPLLITGRLGDRFGPRTLYLAGLALFTVSSLACGLAHNIEALIVARAFQGLGGAMVTPQTMSVMIRTFSPRERGGAMGVWGATAGVATITGPLLGGLLVDAAGWAWIFFVNVPIGINGLVLALRFVPKLDNTARSFDWAGVVISAIGMFCLIFGIQEAERLEWSWPAWALIGAGLAFLAGFAVWQRHMTGEPLVPPSLFSDRNYTLAALAVFTVGFAISTYIIPWMIYIQQARGFSPTHAALLILPAGVVSGALAPYVGKLTNTMPPKPFAIAGLALTGVSIVLMALITNSAVNPNWLLAISVVSGLGNSMMWGPLSMIATRNLDPRLAGAGSSVYNTVRQVGAVIGSAAIATLMTAQLNRHMGPGAGDDAFARAMSNSMWLPAIVILAGAAIATGFARTRTWDD